MRKILVVIADALVLVLTGVAFGLGGMTAFYRPALPEKQHPVYNYYQMVWADTSHLSAINVIVFLFFCIAAVITIIAFFDMKGRKWLLLAAGIIYVTCGILMLYSPKFYLDAFADRSSLDWKLGGGLIGMGVLVIISGAFSALGFVLDIFADRAKA